MTAAACRPRAILGAMLMSGVALSASSAQSGSASGLTATVDAGTSRIHYDGYLPSGLLDLAPTLRLDMPRAVLVARGSVARFASGNVNTQGMLVGSGFTEPRGALRGELSGSASLGHHESIGSTGIGQLTGRLHAARANAGAWAGLGWGWSALGGGLGAGVSTHELGGWLRRPVGAQGSLRATAILRATNVADVRYAEATGALRWSGTRLELGLDGGARQGDRALGSGTERVWVSGDATYWLRPRLAVVAAAGNFLSDPTTSAIGGRYANVGLRLALRRPSPDVLPRVLLPREVNARRPPASEGAAPAGEGLAVEETGDGRVTLRFTLPGTASAELMGDFNGWNPVPLRLGADGRWSVTLALAPGIHRVNLRSDTGQWRAPPGLTAVDDGFGGQVGLLVVSR